MLTSQLFVFFQWLYQTLQFSVKHFAANRRKFLLGGFLNNIKVQDSFLLKSSWFQSSYAEYYTAIKRNSSLFFALSLSSFALLFVAEYAMHNFVFLFFTKNILLISSFRPDNSQLCCRIPNRGIMSDTKLRNNVGYPAHCTAPVRDHINCVVLIDALSFCSDKF